MANPAVLDTSALLAVVFMEPGADKVLDFLDGGLLSSVNLAEMSTILTLRGMPPDRIRGRIADMGCEVCVFNENLAHLAGELAVQTHTLGLSLGDRACLALALEHKATVYTTDRTWKNLNLGIEVEVIR